MWIRDSEGKANLLAATLAGKYALAEHQANEYSALEDGLLEWLVDRAEVLHRAVVRDVIATLREDSATGPDTRIIKRCAEAFAIPVYLLAMAILASGRWPDLYTVHWVACLYKKKKRVRSKELQRSPHDSEAR